MKKVLFVIGILLLVLVLAFVGVCIWYNDCTFAVTPTEVKYVKVEIPEGSTFTQVAEILEENGIIKSALAMRIFAKLNGVGSNIKAGKFNIPTSDDLTTIIAHLESGDYGNDDIKITFIEGKNMRWIATRIAEKTDNTEEDVFETLEDEEYIDSLIEKYWFLTEDIKNKDIYYPLEGYLHCDTYFFAPEKSDVKTIFGVLLDETEKFLEPYKESIESSGYTVHELLTLASMAELEAHSDDDRAEVVGVFLNRIKKKMSLGSDVTTYYAFKVDMAERNLTKTELNTENPYNTRGPKMFGKLPVGPICNPSNSAILATFKLQETTALYFVSDKNNKTYFSDTEAEQQKVIKDLKAQGLWYTYE